MGWFGNLGIGFRYKMVIGLVLVGIVSRVVKCCGLNSDIYFMFRFLDCVVSYRFWMVYDIDVRFIWGRVCWLKM